MIQGKDICKKFGDFQALDRASFHVPKGAVYGLVGPNGAGKSTILRHVTGIFRQDSGELLIDGEPVFENPEAKRKLTFIPDDVFYFRQANLKEMKKYYEGIIRRLMQRSLTSSWTAFRQWTGSATYAGCQRECRSRRHFCWRSAVNRSLWCLMSRWTVLIR